MGATEQTDRKPTETATKVAEAWQAAYRQLIFVSEGARYARCNMYGCKQIGETPETIPHTSDCPVGIISTFLHAAPAATTYNLSALKEAAEEACKQAALYKAELLSDAVNWADLHCFSTEFCINDNQTPFYRVLIAEADSDCPKLKRFISVSLEKKGFQNVEVHTEW